MSNAPKNAPQPTIIEQLLSAVQKHVPTRVIFRDITDPYLARAYLFRRCWLTDALEPSIGMWNGRELTQKLIDAVIGSTDTYKGQMRRSALAALIDQYLPSNYLHYFYRGDNEEELHNHPWSLAISIILTNGYIEERRTVGNRGEVKVEKRVLRPGSINIIRGNDFHRVTLLDKSKGCWTLFFTFRREQDWGFWHPETHEFLLHDEHERRGAARKQQQARAS